MIARMRTLLAALFVLCLSQAASAQCAPAPDSPYFFRNLSEQRAEAKIADNRAVFEDLLSDSFAAQGAAGKSLTKKEFIEAELAGTQVAPRRRFYSISDYQLVDHRQGHTVVTYLLREGRTSHGQTLVLELQLTEVYEVVDGRWRLASLETAPPAADPQLSGDNR